jgi:hypothetical protein
MKVIGWKHDTMCEGHQGWNMMSDIHVLVYCFKFCFCHTQFTIVCYIYIYILTIFWSYIIYVTHSCSLSFKNEQLLFKTHFPNLEQKTHLNKITSKYVINIISPISTHVVILFINKSRSSSILRRKDAHLI